MPPAINIFIIEDNETLVEALASILRKEGHRVDYATGGVDGQTRVLAEPATYELLILDWLLPDKSGLEICRELRARRLNLPILMLTGKDRTAEKVAALGAGADDYLTKPFALAELSARVRALARRPRRTLGQVLSSGDLRLDPEARKVWLDGREVSLTLKEFSILEYLLRHPNQVVSREQLLDHVWDYNFDSFSNIIDVHINNLRKKISPRDGGNGILETVRGVGYCARRPEPVS